MTTLKVLACITLLVIVNTANSTKCVYKGKQRFENNNCLNCFDHKHVCVNKTSYQVCNKEANGCVYPNGEIFECPCGYTCTDNDFNPCYKLPTAEIGPFPYCKTLKKCSYAGELQPDPTDCRKYYICLPDSCNHITRVSKVCPLYSTYDPYRQICTFDKINCGTAAPPSLPDCPCGADVVADPKNPNGLYYCLRKLKEELALRHIECETPHFVFDAHKKICKFNQHYCPPQTCAKPSKLVNCTAPCLDANSDKVTNKPLTDDSTCSCTGLFPDLLDCNKYHICTKNCDCLDKKDNCVIEKEIHNCKPGAKFDPETLSCTDKAVKCLCSTREFPFKCVKEGLFSDTQCPHKFYQCTNVVRESYETYLWSCPVNTILDKATGLCSPIVKPCSGHSESDENKQ